jgi:hypothetical protein
VLCVHVASTRCRVRLVRSLHVRPVCAAVCPLRSLCVRSLLAGQLCCALRAESVFRLLSRRVGRAPQRRSLVLLLLDRIRRGPTKPLNPVPFRLIPIDSDHDLTIFDLYLLRSTLANRGFSVDPAAIDAALDVVAVVVVPSAVVLFACCFSFTLGPSVDVADVALDIADAGLLRALVVVVALDAMFVTGFTNDGAR